METKTTERYFFFGLLFATFVFTFFIFKPFWIVLVLGISFAIVLNPIYKWFNRLKFPTWMSSLITVFLFAVIIWGALFGIGVLFFNQSENTYHTIIESGDAKNFLTSIDNGIAKILPRGMEINVSEKISNLITSISNNIAEIFSSTIYTLLSFVLMLLTIFYILKDGSNWKKAIISLSPLSKTDDERIINKLLYTVNGVIKGYLLVSLIQGILTASGLAIFGIPNPILWGIIAMVTALIPTIGTAVILIPAIIFLLATGQITNGVGLLIWSTLMVLIIDNLISPNIVGKKIDLPPILILFSVLGGISLLGPIGILVGPLTISLLHTLTSMYKDGTKQNEIL